MTDGGEKPSKEALLSTLLSGVKGCQSRFGSRTELATEDDDSVKKLCLAFEDVFLHGLKAPDKGKGNLLQSLNLNLNLGGAGRGAQETGSFWPMLRAQLSRHEAERFLLLRNVRSDFGRARAWLRAALNEHSLERYILTFLAFEGLGGFYEDWAFLRDPELSAILPQTAAGLGSVLFALGVDNPVLDCWVRKPVISKEDNVASPVEVAEVADLFLSGMKEETLAARADATPTSSKYVKKKKKKPHVNVVSFDDEDGQGSSSSVPFTSSTPGSSSPGSTPTPTPDLPYPQPRLRRLDSSTSTASNSTISSAPVQIHRKRSQEENPSPTPSASNLPEISVYSSSVKSVDCISINSVYSDCSERLDIDNVDFNFGRISPSQRLKPLQGSEAPSGSELGVPSPDGDGDSTSSQDLNLIPVPNFDPTNPAPQLKVDVDLGLDLENLKHFQGTPSPVITPASTRQSFPQEYQEDERITKLKVILDREVETVATLQAQLAEEKRRATDVIKILEAKVDTLTKDNEVLKHQLNKYVGAVQLLKKKGMKVSSFDEEEDSFENKEETSPILSAISEEALEYERKLIQVAEMHGELMEFNSHLQSSLRKRDAVIRRLREELVDLRGPLSAPLASEEGHGFDDGSWDIVDSGSTAGSHEGSSRRIIHLTQNERVLINIWIPSAFLTGAATDLHHVYQVFIRIKDTEWNVYRRYSQFYSLHRDLKKKDPVIGSFYFPPKKHLGNKDGKFVDERRRKLQDYLRNVINHTLQTNSILAAHPDKNLLISIFPFFGESTFTNHKKKEQKRRNLFFRSGSSPQNHNSPSGFQTSYPQYTGL